MATAYLNAGATSLAAMNWSDATGFADAATLVIGAGTQTITTATDQSSLTEGITSLIITKDFAGTIGSASAPLKCDVDSGGVSQWNSGAASGNARMEYYGSGTVYYEADGDENRCGNLFIAGPGSFIQSGAGTTIFLSVSAGSYYASPSTPVTNGYLTGGRTVLDSSSGQPTLVECWANQVLILKRPPTTLTVHGGTVIIDIDNATAIGTLNQHGGTITHKAGNITTANFNSGTYDPSGLNRDATITTANRRAACILSETPKGATLTIATDNKLERHAEKWV